MNCNEHLFFIGTGRYVPASQSYFTVFPKSFIPFSRRFGFCQNQSIFRSFEVLCTLTDFHGGRVASLSINPPPLSELGTIRTTSVQNLVQNEAR